MKGLAYMKVGRFLVIFLLGMALLLAFGNNGLIDNLIMKEKLRIIQDANCKLNLENNQLRREIIRLRDDPQYIEALARNEFGMVRKGELVYRFAD